MKRVALSLALVTCLALLAMTASGCQMIAQKATEKAIEAGTGGAVNVNGDEVTFTGEDGKSATVSSKTELPADFPSDVPMKDGGAVKAVITSDTSGGGKAYMVSIQFKEPQAEVMSWYQGELESGGWKILNTVTTGDGGMITAEKGDLTLNLVFSADNTDGFQSVLTMQVAPKTK